MGLLVVWDLVVFRLLWFGDRRVGWLSDCGLVVIVVVWRDWFASMFLLVFFLVWNFGLWVWFWCSGWLVLVGLLGVFWVWWF